jgi:hypothetical protein
MLNEKDRLLLRSYHNQLRQPKLRFIVINGLVWGILMLVGMTLIEYVFQKKDIRAQWEDSLPLRIILMPYAGLLYGWIVRKLIEKKYHQLKKREDAS